MKRDHRPKRLQVLLDVAFSGHVEHEIGEEAVGGRRVAALGQQLARFENVEDVILPEHGHLVDVGGLAQLDVFGIVADDAVGDGGA